MRRFRTDTLDFSNLDFKYYELINETIENYVQWLYRQGYTQEKIILIENKRAVAVIEDTETEKPKATRKKTKKVVD